MEMKHPIDSLMVTAMNSIKEMIDVNTIIGDPIQALNNTVIIPISKVGFGFAAGGCEFNDETVNSYNRKEKEENINYRLPFGGGSGAGVNITPVAFLIVQNDSVKLLEATHSSVLDKLVEYVPDAIEKINQLFNKKLDNEKKEEYEEYDDYDDESYRDEELLEEAEKEKTANKMFNILNIYETFDKKNKKKHEDRKSGELDEKTKEKQQQAKIEEEKYDHLLNSMQAQTLIKAVEKYGKDEEDRKEIDAIPIELPKEKSDLDKIAEYAMSRNIDSVNIKDFSTHDIEVYVREQCDIMEEAATHVENAKAEYEAVTEEYNDIQIMEEAPTQIRDKILSCAETIDNMMVDRRILKSTEHKLSNAAYRRMEAVENEMPGGIKLLKASEDYYDTVKRDLRILEAEQLNLRTDADVLVTRQIKIRRLAKTAIFALAAVFAVFLISMTLVQNDSDTALFIGISLFAAILAVGMFALLKVTERNVIITEIKLNKATALLNKVKIKFINAANTLDYEYTKFGVKSSYELDKKYRLYEEMKKEQIRMLDMTSSLNSAENELENMLKNLGLYSPHIWLGRVRAIINPKEMVEVRHEINTRRYKLRQQIEYNEKRIDEAKENIKKITLSNPAHSDGAMRVIEMYEKRHSRVAK